jgi:hypothetical protein
MPTVQAEQLQVVPYHENVVKTASCVDKMKKPQGESCSHCGGRPKAVPTNFLLLQKTRGPRLVTLNIMLI